MRINARQRPYTPDREERTEGVDRGEGQHHRRYEHRDQPRGEVGRGRGQQESQKTGPRLEISPAMEGFRKQRTFGPLDLGRGWGTGNPHDEKRQQSQQKGGEIDQDNRAQTAGGEQRGPDHRRDELHSGAPEVAQTGGTRKVPLGDQQRSSRRVGGPLKSTRNRGDRRREVDMPDLDRVGEIKRRQCQGTHGGNRIAQDHRYAAVPAIDQCPGERRQQDSGQGDE